MMYVNLIRPERTHYIVVRHFLKDCTVFFDMTYFCRFFVINIIVGFLLSHIFVGIL